MPSSRPHVFSALEIPDGIGARLRGLREEAGLTQAALSGRSGVGRRTIIRLERGADVPQANTVLRLVQVLLADRDDIELSDIVPGWPEMDARHVIGIGPRCRLRRQELGLSLKSVAEAVGVSEGTMSRFERGMSSHSKLVRIERSPLGDIMPRICSLELAHCLQFSDLRELDAWCDP